MPPLRTSSKSLSIYEQLLGDRFWLLPEVLQRFHGSTSAKSAEGIFQVRRAHSFLGNLLASLLGFPKAGDEISVRLEVHASPDSESWIRSFNGHILQSIQTAKGRYLSEQLGLFEILQEVEVEPPRLYHRSISVRFLGCPLPAIFAPRIASVVEPTTEGWYVKVNVEAPILGPILEYSGRVVVR